MCIRDRSTRLMRYSLSTTARKLPLDRFRGGARTDQEQDVLPTLSGYINRVLVRKVLFQALLVLMVVTSRLAHGIGPLFFLSLVAFVSASLGAWGSYLLHSSSRAALLAALAICSAICSAAL
eukprot:4138819-Prymnesium_polylepis.1